VFRNARVLIPCVLGLLLLVPSTARTAPGRHKGELYFYWGYNGSVYSASDIHFEGPGYDFTLNQVTAHDKPTEFSAGIYLNPTRMTIPQYEARIGFYIGERTNVSLGVTHIKYVMTQDQGTTITGEIDSSASVPFAGIYDNTVIGLGSNFLQFEHTDGLNYGNAEIETMIPAWENKARSLGFYVTTAVGAGIVVPKSNVTLFGQERSDHFNLAGFGLNSKVGVKFEFLKHFFLHYFISAGWMDLSGIPTRAGGEDTAAQSLYYLESAVVGGMTVHTF
jgi:hypothetical protein